MVSKNHQRNQSACDICRSRRVKCQLTEGEDSCDGCRFLGVPCTSNKPRRKRGPPNRHAIQANAIPGIDPSPPAIHPLSPESSQSSILPTPTDSPLVASPPTYWPELKHNILHLLAPTNLINTVLNDWFTHIHPLAPILHQRRFLTRLRNGEAKADPIFCALVISVLCATCGTLRRKSFTQYHPITLDRCIELIRSHGLLPVDGPYTLDWCIAKYNLATASMAHRDLSDPWTHRVVSEAVSGTRYLLAFKVGGMGVFDREILKRLHCLIEICVTNFDMLGRSAHGRLPLERGDLAHLQPKAYTDAELDSSSTPITGTLTQRDILPNYHCDNTSYVPGLIYLHAIFQTWHICQTDRFYLPAVQVLNTGLTRVQTTIDTLPPELRWRGGLSRPATASPGHDVQIANILITSLYVRSNLIQQFGTPSNAQNEAEHQRIVSDLLEVLEHLPMETLEANGYSLIPKIRDIGGAYLEVLRGDLDGPLVAIADLAKGRLERLLTQLGVLDFRPGV